MTNIRTHRRFTACIAGIALLLGMVLHAQNWSEVPADQFVQQAVAALTETAEQNPGALAAQLAAILNAAAAIEELTDDNLVQIAAAAYAGKNVDPFILVRTTPLIEKEHRARIANILRTAAPPNARPGVAAVITELNLPTVPPVAATVREATLPPVSKE